MERAFVRVLPWLGVGLAAAVPLLALPAGRPLLVSTLHLSGVVALAVGAALALAPIADEPGWFAPLAPAWRPLASAAVVVALVAGMAGLVALASGAALRLEPSLQFLQVLGALDIAWAAAALVVGVRRGWGTAPAVTAGAVLGAACVGVIWNYLRTVGFTAGGGWVVDGAALWRLVLPADMAAAVLAGAALLVGTRRGQRMAQLRPQS